MEYKIELLYRLKQKCQIYNIKPTKSYNMSTSIKELEEEVRRVTREIDKIDKETQDKINQRWNDLINSEEDFKSVDTFEGMMVANIVINLRRLKKPCEREIKNCVTNETKICEKKSTFLCPKCKKWYCDDCAGYICHKCNKKLMCYTCGHEHIGSLSKPVYCLDCQAN